MRISDWSSDVCSSDLVAGDQFLGVDPYLLGRRCGSRLQHDHRVNALAPFLVGKADDGAGRHRRMARDGVLYFCRIDILAAGNDHVLHAINHIEIAVLVQIAGITGVHPAVAQRRSEEHTSELQSLMRISYAVFCLNKTKSKT